MENNYENLYLEMESKLEEVHLNVSDPLQRFRETITIINTTLEQLKKEAIKTGFHSDDDEILFFKHIKPKFYAQKILESEKYKLEINKPVGTAELQIAFFETEIQYISRFFRLNSFHYQYYKLKMTELDSLYFLRNSEPNPTVLFELAEVNPEFSTPMDYLFSKFMALTNYQDYLLKEIARLKKPSGSLDFGTDSKTLKWTGDTINLVEIAYGIWLTGQINNGTANVSEIVRWLEDKFQVKIGRAHRRWTEISGRKRSSYTKFIDKMKEVLEERIDEELGVDIRVKNQWNLSK